MHIQIKDTSTGIIYDNDMGKNDHAILEIHFSTSYTEVIVQDKVIENGEDIFKQRELIIEPLNSKPWWVDRIAAQGLPRGEFVTNELQEL